MVILPEATAIPLHIGVIHFVGIGGIGMSGIAEILHNLGYHVQGSDASDSANVIRLRHLGIVVFLGHEAKNIKNAAVIVKSSAITDDNAEIIEARILAIPVIKRAEMLGELCRLKVTLTVTGTHGKTTTTTMLNALFDEAGLDPTVLNGGIINRYGTNARLGKGKFLIAEADESDGTFIRLPATAGIITNINAEHLDYYQTFENLYAACVQYVQNLPFYGFAVLCNDHEIVRKLITSVKERRIITYGIEHQSDVQAINIRKKDKGSVYDVIISPHVRSSHRFLKDVYLPMPGIHNVLNSLAAITMALEFQIDPSYIYSGFAQFQGVGRRFTETGKIGGITIIDDYGHHPHEIEVTLKTARSVIEENAKIIAVLQPHRYSRVRDLLQEFGKATMHADVVIISDIYGAGEAPIEHINKEVVIETSIKAGHKCIIPLDALEELPELVMHHAREGDIIVFLGAGTVTHWAHALPEQLKKLYAIS